MFCLIILATSYAGNQNVVGIYTTHVDADTANQMKAVGVTQMIVAFYQTDTSGAVTHAGALKDWDGSMKGDMSAVLSFGGQGASIPRQDTSKHGQAFGQFAAANGFDGMDFDVEDWSIPLISADLVAAFVSGAISGFRANSKQFPQISFNPGLFDNPSDHPGEPKSLSASIGAVRQVYNALEAATPGDGALYIQSLKFSVQFYNCYVQKGQAAGSSYYHCNQSPEGLQEMISTYGRVLSEMEGTPFSTENLIVGKPSAPCCEDSNGFCTGGTVLPGGTSAGGSSKACAPMCSPNTAAFPNPASACAFADASSLGKLVGGELNPLLNTTGVFLWEWNQAWASHAYSIAEDFVAGYTGSVVPPPPPTPAPKYGEYTVAPGDGCFAIAAKLCSATGTQWKQDICKSDSVCSNLQVGQVIAYDCSGNGAHCGGGAPTPSPPSPTPAGSSGSYTVEPGDGCWSITDKLCHDGSAYAKDICNSATVCSALQAGQIITYDCSGTGAHCR